jgi:poly(glycerol-phosphate) alpha-glucosyltransferase
LWDPIQPRIHSGKGPAAFGYAPTLQQTLNSIDADLVHSQGLWMYHSIASSRWQQHRAKPSLVSAHGMLNPWALNHSRWKKRLAGLLFENGHLRRTTCLHALCRPEAQAFRAYGLRNPICVIPNGVDLPDSSPNLPPPWEACVPEGSKVLLYLGRFDSKKGLVPLIHGWRKFQTLNPGCLDWVLVVAGWDQGGFEAELKSQVRGLNMDKTVRFLGPLYGEVKSAALEHAAAVALPSFSEGLPMTVLEAWAWGKPVLMTAACNLGEGFEAGAALPMDPEADSICRALQTLVCLSERERLEMGRRGRELVARRFTWKRIAGEMKQVYSWILGGGNRPECVEMISLS